MPELLPPAEYLKVLVGLLAIVNPFGAIPVFISLTEGAEHTRVRAAGVASASMAIILLVVLALGEAVLSFFGISIGSFRVGGGILVLLIAISMLNATPSPTKQTQDEAEESAARDSIAVVPLSIPLLAGPGTMSTVIVYGHRATSLLHHLALAAIVIVLALVVYAALRAAPALSERLGKTGINIVTRIMGLILAAIAVEFIASGLRTLFPALAG